MENSIDREVPASKLHGFLYEIKGKILSDECKETTRLFPVVQPQCIFNGIFLSSGVNG